MNYKPPKKPKTYLNSKEKDNVVAIGTFAQHMQDVLDDWQDNLNGAERKYLGMSISFALKVIESLLLRLDRSQARLIHNYIKATRCICMPKETAEDTLKKAQAELEHEPVYVDSEYFNDILYQCLLACEDCRFKAEDEKDTCKARHAMLAMDVPVYDSQAKGCPYEIIKDDCAVKYNQADIQAMHNELCYMCGKYKTAHLGACDGCRWNESEVQIK